MSCVQGSSDSGCVSMALPDETRHGLSVIPRSGCQVTCVCVSMLWLCIGGYPGLIHNAHAGNKVCLCWRSTRGRLVFDWRVPPRSAPSSQCTHHFLSPCPELLPRHLTITLARSPPLLLLLLFSRSFSAPLPKTSLSYIASYACL